MSSEKNDLFATKLLSGMAVAASPKAMWWPRHSRGMRKYVLLAGPSTHENLELLQSSCGLACVEWEAFLPREARKGLMGKHVSLEIALVDAAREKSPGRIDRLGKALLENAAGQAAALATTVQEFPEDRFRRLLDEHVGLVTETVRMRMQGLEPTKLFEIRSKENMLSLADFTSEWL